MKKQIAAALSVAITVTGCATASKDIAATSVSPIQYQAYSCEQIAGEGQRIATRVSQLSGRLDQAAANDKAIAGVGAILFWPALFALGGTKEQEAEYARLKGESEALQQAAIVRNCGTYAPIATGTTINPSSMEKADPVLLSKVAVTNKESELRDLKKLHDAGLISKEAYNDRQAKVLAN